MISWSCSAKPISKSLQRVVGSEGQERGFRSIELGTLSTLTPEPLPCAGIRLMCFQ